MESKPKSGVAAARVVEEFEPSMDWVRDTGADTLQIHLPGFKKEQLKVQVTSMRVLRISGERQLSENRWSTFRKEIPISSNYDTNEINAKFDKGILYVKHPKVIVLETTMEETLAYDQNQAQEKAKSSLQVSSKSEQMSSPGEGKVGSPSDSATETKKQPEDNLVGMEKQDGGKEENENLSTKTSTKEKESVINGWKDKSTKNGQVGAEAEGTTRSKSAKPENLVDSSLDSTNTIKEEAEKGKLGKESYKQGVSGAAMDKQGVSGAAMDMKKSRTLVNLLLVILFILVLGMYGRNAIRSLKKSDI
ncbi:hypothetical protein OIU76_030298 [Salix suchowensis]|nr:heat shock family protein [Salix suchowensis]KAJ6365494.1 hypothetical protein OIU76_030298 [Salix suchowensis]